MNKTWYNINMLAKNVKAVVPPDEEPVTPMEPDTDEECEIMVYDEIGGYGISAVNFINDIKALPENTKITLRINSVGGSVFEGWAIYNYLQEIKDRVVCKVDGLAASISSVIALAGSKCVMPENSMLMIHNAWNMVVGNAEQLVKEADLLNKIDNQMAELYGKKCGKPADEMKKMMDNETWLTGKQCVEMGLADEMLEACSAQMSIKPEVMAKWKNMPEALKPVDTEILALKKTVSEQDATISTMQVQLSYEKSMVEQLKKEKEEVVNQLHTAKISLQEMHDAINALNGKLNEFNLKEADAYIDKQIAFGKIKSNDKEKWINRYVNNPHETIDLLDSITPAKNENKPLNLVGNSNVAVTNGQYKYKTHY